jgi:hypothetical protein
MYEFLTDAVGAARFNSGGSVIVEEDSGNPASHGHHACFAPSMAPLVGAFLRGEKIRKPVPKRYRERHAATCIQMAQRSRVARQAANDLWCSVESDAAVMLQCALRGAIARRRVRSIQEAAAKARAQLRAQMQAQAEKQAQAEALAEARRQRRKPTLRR